jgi:GTP cyclohydrolase II
MDPVLNMLKIRSEALVPIRGKQARMIVFSVGENSDEHVAVVFGQPKVKTLVRIHSECLTGDVFGSERCDCGAQLNHAMSRMADQNEGVLLYLRQEGRGIGLTAKLKAYAIQDKDGADTFEANRNLGFADDLRTYDAAALMFNYLGIQSIQLLTNNPIKIESMKRLGMISVEQETLPEFSTAHNQRYLEAKKRRSLIRNEH